MIGKAHGSAGTQADSHDAGDDSDWDFCFIQHRALLDVQFQITCHAPRSYFRRGDAGRVATHSRKPIAQLFSLVVLPRRDIRRQNACRCR